MKIFLILVVVLVIGGVGWLQYRSSVETDVVSMKSQSDTSAVVSETQQSIGQTFTMAQVAEHKDQSNCYTVIRGMVYDVTAFIEKHPGGDTNILKTCGIDATTLFEGKHGGQEKPEATLAGFVVGTLVE